jgi:hypothetical protein
MTRSPEAWRRIVKVCGAVGLVLVAGGYVVLQDAARAYRTAGLLAFYGGFALVIAAIVGWYRHVPPRPPAREEVEEVDDANSPDWE